MSLKFVNLHGHDGQSVYDAIGSPTDYSEWMLKNAGEDSGALAITNHGNMNSIGAMVEAQKRYTQSGTPVKFLYGVEAYYIPSIVDWRQTKETIEAEKKEEKKRKKAEPESELVIENEKESKDWTKKYYNPINRRNHLVLVAINNTGLQNLYRIVSRSYREGFYRKPRVDIKLLKQFNEGIIASTACIHPDAILRTSVGDLRIEDVVHRVKAGEEIYVLGLNEAESRPTFKKVTWGDKTRKKAKLLKIKLKNGHELKLTSDHKVYTDRGWIEAGQLTKTDKILGIPPS